MCRRVPAPRFPFGMLLAEALLDVDIMGSTHIRAQNLSDTKSCE